MLQTGMAGEMKLFGTFLSQHPQVTDGYHPIVGGGGSPGMPDDAWFEEVELFGQPPRRVRTPFSPPGRTPTGSWLQSICAGFVGGAAARNGRLTLDYGASRFWFEPAPASAEEPVDRLLARLGDPRAKDPAGMTPLMHVAYDGRVDAAAALLDRGADPNAATPGDVTALILAARQGNEGVVKLLLDHGADPNVRAAAGLAAALHDASARGYANVVKALLSGKADARAADLRGLTPLHLAAEAGSAASVEALLAGGAEPNSKDKQDETPLLMAALSGEPAVMQAILKAGGDPNAAGSGDITPLLLAAATAARTDCLKALLDAGAKPNTSDRAGRTPLMVAASRGAAEIVTILLAHGADPTAKSVESKTAADYAADSAQAQTLRLLLGAAPPAARH